MLSALIRDHVGSWGIFVFSLWALILTIVAVARIILLTGVVEFVNNEYSNQLQIWIIFILNVIFGVGFGASSYGLFRRQSWGRILFLWTILIWTGFNLLAVFLFRSILPSNNGAFVDSLPVNIVRFALGGVISVWYFNIPRVKARFSTGSSEEFTTEA
jgi:hypothetical protein